MPSVSVTRTIDAPLDQLWASWDEFGDIARFNPNLNASFLIANKQPTGKGAERQCDLSDGKTFLKERIVGYEPHRRLDIDIYESNMPIKNARATFDFRARGPKRSEVTMTMHFTPPMGPLGYLMLPLMKPQMRGLLAKLLDGNKAFVERGVEIDRMAA
ncbi:SRPBCC family protein [Hasllibacter sp. MH4015]|uniref:SRPBCC family protein n=1 Tax=Hasllibacter sp. MH4015 TaxID=2854029 RepID=UPI001CD7EC10|nr:SRPBCC family protein [Hasllibacter sp. MH4015]